MAKINAEIIDTPQWEEGESTPGAWVRITSDDPFCDYKCCTAGPECREAIGAKIVSLLTGEN